MILPSHIRIHVIRPALEGLFMWSQSAEDLLMGTAAQESHMGKYLVQLRGPACGIFQMEPSTESDIWENFINYKPAIQDRLYALCGVTGSSPEKLKTDLLYAAAMARLHYRRVPENLPGEGNLAGYARYWKRFYNTPLGHGTEEQFVRNYGRFVLRDKQ